MKRLDVGSGSIVVDHSGSGTRTLVLQPSCALEVELAFKKQRASLLRGFPAWLQGRVSDEDLRLAGSLAAASRHPLSQAIVRAAENAAGMTRKVFE